MYWLHLTTTQKKRITKVLRTPEIQDPFADQCESLRWTAFMITGSAELTERSIIDATRLGQTRSLDFRDWLVLWAHLATARTAFHAVRSSIHESAKRYANWTCSHSQHEPLPWAKVQSLQGMKIEVVVQHLDVLARAVLVLRGCHRASFEDCVFLLNVPLQPVVGAYCTALQWCESFAQPAGNIQNAQLSQPSGLPAVASAGLLRWIGDQI